MEDVFKNQSLKVTLACKDNLGNVIDLTGQDANIKLLILDPSGNETTETPTIVSPPTSGVIEYTFPINTLDEVGVWSVKGYLNTEQVPSTKYKFRVIEKWNA